MEMTSPVTTELNRFGTVLFRVMLELKWTFGLAGMPSCLMTLGNGMKLRDGLLVPTWNLTVRLRGMGALRLKLGTLAIRVFLVTVSRVVIRLMLAILLAMGRLIRTCAPILTNDTALLGLIRNLMALVSLQRVWE